MSVAYRAAEPATRKETAEVPVADPAILGAPSFRWVHPEAGRALAAFGEVERREGPTLRSLFDSAREGTWFGAVMFDPLRARGPEWAGFPAARFTLPALLYSQQDGRATITAFGEGARRRLDDARRALDAAPPAPPEAPARGSQVAGDGRQRWDSLLSLALRHIRAGTLDKVVLARTLDVETGVDADSALRSLSQSYPSCRAYLVRTQAGAFVGATPEILCRIAGDEVFSDALAGSAPPPEAARLLESPKELREHAWVVEHVVSGLERICAGVEHGPRPAVRTLPNVAHLHTPIRGRLRPGRTVADVVEALHPTPAVGGVPSGAALQFIREYEGFDRGLYAGLVGVVSPGETELAVALRCALLRPGRARLFAGAGIVEGSSAEAEWAETALKARPLLQALGVPA